MSHFDVICFRPGAEMRIRIEDASAALGISMSDWIRIILDREIAGGHTIAEVHRVAIGMARTMLERAIASRRENSFLDPNDPGFTQEE